MSRIGKKPVAIPEGVTATVDGKTVTAKGPKGELQIVLDAEVNVAKTEAGIEITPRNNTKVSRSKWGLSRTLVANIMVGVTEGYTKSLEINGVGYRAAMKGKNIQLLLGFSHDVVYEVPDDVTVVCPKPTEITVSGIDKQKVGQVAAEIRSYRSPEPYKGKGVKYADEVIFRKEGKKK